MTEAPWKAQDPARGQRIRAERERVGWTRTQLAELAGASRNTIESWERGGRFQQRASAERLARVFNWSYADLMGVSPEEAAKPAPRPTPKSRARSRPDSPITRSDIDDAQATVSGVVTSTVDAALREGVQVIFARIDDLGTEVKGLREDLERLTQAQSATGAQLGALVAQVSALLATEADRERSRTPAQSKRASHARAKKPAGE